MSARVEGVLSYRKIKEFADKLEQQNRRYLLKKLNVQI